MYLLDLYEYCVCIHDVYNYGTFPNFDLLLQWLEHDFIGYLDSWEIAVAARPGFSPTEKKKMLLSNETLTGLRFTGTYI